MELHQIPQTHPISHSFYLYPPSFTFTSSIVWLPSHLSRIKSWLSRLLHRSLFNFRILKNTPFSTIPQNTFKSSPLKCYPTPPPMPLDAVFFRRPCPKKLCLGSLILLQNQSIAFKNLPIPS